MINWKYKEELKDQRVFETIENQYHVAVPEEIKALVYEANGATPDKELIDINGVERIFGAVLSFNEGDLDNVYDVLEVNHEANVLPFGVDPFGNYFCYHVKRHVVLFYDHEVDRYVRTNYNLEEFLNHLY